LTASERLTEAERLVVIYAENVYDRRSRIISEPGLISKVEEMAPEGNVLSVALKFELQIEPLGKGKRASSDAEGCGTGKRRRPGLSYSHRRHDNDAAQ